MPRRIFDPKSKHAFKISRSKLELFLECPKCFYLDQRHGIKRPGGYPLSLNLAVDELLKKEFDLARAKDKMHPLMKEYKIKAIPFAHQDIDTWRHNFTGVQIYHEPTNFIVFGAVDDVWIDSEHKLIVVDYKATSTREEITLNDKYKGAYKRQMEIYQWLLKQKGFRISKTGYFVFCNADKDKKAFDKKLEFEVTLIPYKGKTNWVEPAIIKAHKVLKSKRIPKASNDCQYCNYREAVKNAK